MELIDKKDLLKRMSIGAPMDWGHNESEKVRDEQYRDDMLTIQCCQPVPAIPIPAKATNGDMIKAMFNPYKICEYEYSVHVYMTEEVFWKAEYQMNYDTRWWNAPYRKE